MKFTKTIFTILFIAALSFFAQSAYAQEVKTNDLNLTAEQCETLGGKWNQCPPNECQKTSAYQTGEVMCPQVCGEPQCQGLVPVEDEDLSNIHNIDLNHQPIIRGQDAPENKPQEPLLDTKQEQAPKQALEPANTEATGGKINWYNLYLILGFILLLIFVVLKYKSRPVK
jgi:hypothetical protein